MTDNQQPSVEFRECRKCGETKQFEDFALIYIKGQDYRQHTCKNCAKILHAARMKKARDANPEKYRLHQRRHYGKHRNLVNKQHRDATIRKKLRAMDAYGGAACVCCSESCLTMLTIDHINNDGNKHRNEINGGAGRAKSVDFYVWLKKHNYPAGFQVLCYNCNMSKHRNKGVCEHKLDEGSTTSRKA